MNESQLEELCLAWFAENGWESCRGPDIAPDGDVPERPDYRQVILLGDLESAVRRLNPQLPETAVEQVMSLVAKPGSLDPVVSNRAFHQLLLEGVPVIYKQDEHEVHDHAFLIDFAQIDANRFRAINQFTIAGGKQLRRPDVIAFINGLPLAVIELKSPGSETADITGAFNQLQTYKTEIPDLFVTNEALVISDGYTARVGSLTADQERFMPWRTIKNEDDKPLLEWQLETLVRGFFDRALFLDYLRYFVLFEIDAERVIKKIAGYHQFHAVREAVKATVIAAEEPAAGVGEKRATYGDEVEPGSKKAGVVWHTQGSGKSISMVCYAGKLLQQPAMHNPTLIVVTDRNDLDGQLFGTFSSARDLLKQDPIQAEDRESLRQKLAERESGGIIFTTVQKFALLDDERGHPILNGRHNIVVISDEAHRSQYGLKATLKQDGQYTFGFAKHMRDALPNASFIGFTGTPIASEDKDTRAVFGDYVSIYDIQDAVDDGATVPIFYESRLARLDINREEINQLSEQVDDLIKDEEDTGARERTKGEWSRLEKLMGAEPRLQRIAADLVDHFEMRNQAIEGKAMIVAMSRSICARLYSEIVKLRPDWHDDDPEKGAIKVIMTGSAADSALLTPHIYNKATKKRLEKRFKNPADPLKLVIVRDMWLTGFDAPCCHTMYVDKPMKGHNLMQAIARVNRVFKDKPGGLVVDYIGIANELKNALKVYTDSRGRGQPTYSAEEAFAVLEEKLDIIHGMFARGANREGFDYSGFEEAPHKLLPAAANYLLSLDDGKKRFLDTMLQLTKAYSLCSTLDEARALHKEIAFLSAIKTALVKHTSTNRSLSEAQKNSALKQILDNAVKADDVTDVFALCGLEKPNIGLLSDEFLEDVRQMPHRNLAVELLEKLLKDDIKARTRTNAVQEKKYSDRLQETLRKYNNRGIETAQVIEELIEMARQFKADMERDEALGLNPDEIAFYDALITNESAVRELGDDRLRALAVEVTNKLRSSTTVDWQVRESVRARLRILVRRTLQRYKYPPDKSPEVIELILRQAELLSNQWSR
ncbi:type I restriction endonuclease subunit R [Kushneria aurantia]|uniref:Type I restriction enzyme endonuclease subunit n=1 Tax=Kushneria aurantia TaxID=504092 RepID=A0ABV6G0F4_9GAMM